jgi:Cysteine dioxygenase type I
MAIAYSDPAAVPLFPPLNRPGGLPFGPGVRTSSRAVEAPSGRRIELLPIAEGFAVSAPAIPELQGVTERSWVLLAVTDLFEAWAIAWPPGGAIELHDHGNSSGAVAVAAGTLVETTVRASDNGRAVISTHRVAAGEHRCFGPHYIHDLVNDDVRPALSVHVYGPRLTTMSYYDLSAAGRLGRLRTESVPPLGPFDATSDHDPS